MLGSLIEAMEHSYLPSTFTIRLRNSKLFSGENDLNYYRPRYNRCTQRLALLRQRGAKSEGLRDWTMGHQISSLLLLIELRKQASSAQPEVGNSNNNNNNNNDINRNSIYKNNSFGIVVWISISENRYFTVDDILKITKKD